MTCVPFVYDVEECRRTRAHHNLSYAIVELLNTYKVYVTNALVKYIRNIPSSERLEGRPWL